MKKHFKVLFTLLELLIVISIIFVLISILMPALGKAKKGAFRISCAGNLKQFAPALAMYTDDNNGYFPGASTSGDGYLWNMGTRFIKYLGYNQDIPDTTHIGASNFKLIRCPADKYPGAAWRTKWEYFYSYMINANMQAKKLNSYPVSPSIFFTFAESGYGASGWSWRLKPWDQSEIDGSIAFFRHIQTNYSFLDGSVKAYPRAWATTTNLDKRN